MQVAEPMPAENKRSEHLEVNVKVLLPKSRSTETLVVRTSHPHGLLGTGAYGAVYKGETASDGIVALKIMHLPTGVVNPNLFDRVGRTLLREFAAGRKIKHSNLAEVHCFGSALWEGQSRFCVMSEFVEGSELRTAALAINNDDERTRVLRELAIGLSEIHKAGVVHRDLSSRNVMLTSGGHVKILDFGIAFFVQATLSSLSFPIDILERDSDASAIKPRGNPPYMAPEVWEPNKFERGGGPKFDPATGLYVPINESDIFAWGIIAYEVLAGGRHPFGIFEWTFKEFKEAICKRRNKVSWPSKAGGSPEIRRLVERCLSRRPQDRPPLQAIIDSLKPSVIDVQPIPTDNSHLRTVTIPQAVTSPATDIDLEAWKKDYFESWKKDDWNECILDESGNCINDNQKHWGANE
jgi:serine/threonine protein kinase